MARSLHKNPAAWWGAPKKFDPKFEDRRISWLELFYDLVYVIAIARITHHLTSHITWSGFAEYACLFILIFWGWLNGSLYHDIHGTVGLRTRLMTLWQILIIAALSVAIDNNSPYRLTFITIVLMVMQFYITYLWWSVGLYDKDHRRYNLPYTVLYLLSLALMGLSLYLGVDWIKWIIPAVIICNYAPPFVSSQLLKRSELDLSLSTSMTERLGLFTIIVFGEVVLGVVNGIGRLDIQRASTWVNFALALSIVFTLWWIFFTLVSNRPAKKGFVTATLLELLFVPTLLSLGVTASCLSYFFDTGPDTRTEHRILGFALSCFITCISLMMGLLQYPSVIKPIMRSVRSSLFVTALVFLGWALTGIELGTTNNLLVMIGILIGLIIFMNSRYYALGIDEASLQQESE